MNQILNIDFNKNVDLEIPLENSTTINNKIIINKKRHKKKFLAFNFLYQ